MFRYVRLTSMLRQLGYLQCQAECKFCGPKRWESPRTQQRFHSTAAAEATMTTETEEAISPPHVEGKERTYSSKVESIVNEISNLTLLEVADLNDLLKKTLNITSIPMMAAGAAHTPSSDQEAEEPEKEQEKVSFVVKLVKFDAAKKVALIKEIKSQLSGMNLVQAKKFVESAPQVVKKDLTKEEAEKLKEALAGTGAEIAIE